MTPSDSTCLRTRTATHKLLTYRLALMREDQSGFRYLEGSRMAGQDTRSLVTEALLESPWGAVEDLPELGVLLPAVDRVLSAIALPDELREDFRLCIINHPSAIWRRKS